ncbi:MAG: hypothetical protein KAW89_03605, partial [Armatimonadetes bacterium]|nr:hypothetical protein [Armatimonadota bacterium]
LLCVGLLALGGSAYAQGFMVKPMKMELTARPGQTVEKALQLRNTTARGTETLMVRALELGQSSGGSWQAIDPANEEVDTSHLRSSLKWMELSADSVDIASMEAENVMVRLKVPRGARGFYGATLLVRSKPTAPKPEPGHIGIGIVIQFLIPVVVNIQGPPARERIELADVDMQYVAATEERPGTTTVLVQVKNSGETYGRLAGKVTVLRQAGKHWQRVADATIPERGIIPGVTITLTEDIERRLPSGRYKLQGILRVGGRPKVRINKEIDFEGDPTITTVAADVPLMLQPPTMTIQAVPGSRRSTVLTVQNPTEETVKVACGVAVPPGLRGVAMGSITGDDFTCAPWTEVNPQTFTIRGGGQRNIRITVKFPHMENAQPNYYADLHLQATYPDGQSAGAMKAMIWVQNAKAESEPQAQAMSLNLAQQEEDKYSVTAQFGNVGNVHFTPAATATVATGIGS